jgi:hypothetical protein
MEDSPMPAALPVVKWIAPYVAAAVIGGAGIGYAVHERHDAENLARQNQQVTAQLTATNKQLDALAAKVNALALSNETKPTPPTPSTSSPKTSTTHRTMAHRTKVQDQRFNKLQSELDAQGKAIDAQGKQIDQTRSDLVSARTELSGSIARTHDELVVLEKKGELNYYEFDIVKSKEFKREGPLSISLRKANTKHQYADLELIVDDRNLTEKHVNLYQPAMFYQPDSPKPLEVVINDISKNHIHGYVSAPKYRQSELAAMSGAGANPQNGQDATTNPSAQPPVRQKLPLPSSSELTQE